MHAPSEPGEMLQTDVLIAGGGMAGATLALALARYAPTLRVTVVEAQPVSADVQVYQPSYDARSTALAWGTRLIYDDLGVWSRIAALATPIRQVHVSERGRFGCSHLSAEEQGVEALGYVVDNRWLGLQLVAALQEDCPSVHWLAPATLCSAQADADGVQLALTRNGAPCRARCQVLVIADGGRSGLAEQLGFTRQQRGYGQHALIANVSAARRHDYVAYERFSAEGPIALLPRGDVRRAGTDAALVWTLADAAVDEVAGLDDPAFLDALQARFGWRLGRLQRVGERHLYPLSLSQVAEPVRPGMVLVGNAAHSLHPVAGQGFNLAIRGLMRLTVQLVRAHQAGRALGALETLQPFAEAHRQDQQLTIGFSDGLIQLFGDATPWLAGIRDAGLLGLDLLPGMRRWFARHTMGIGGRRALAELTPWAMTESAEKSS